MIVEVLEMWKHGDAGVYSGDDGEKIEVPGDQIVSMNMWGFTSRVFPELKTRLEEFLRRDGAARDAEFLVPDVIQDLVREGRARVKVLGPAGQWCGITYPADRERAARLVSRLVSRGDYPAGLWS